MIIKHPEIIIKKNTSKIENIYSHLVAINDCFKPVLNSYIDLDTYSRKLFNYSYRIEAWNEGVLIGLLCIYINDTINKRAFISHVGVLKNYRGYKLSKQLMKESIAICESKGMTSIQLEVFRDNIVAKLLYESFGFNFLTQNDNKFLYELRIK